MRFGFLRLCYYLFLSRSLLDVNCYGWSRGDSGEEHEHQSDAVLESVMVFRLAAGAVAEVVVPLGLAKAGFLSGSTGVLGVSTVLIYYITFTVHFRSNYLRANCAFAPVACELFRKF